MNLNPYLSFNGNCEAAFKFYEQTFGGKIAGILKYAGSPMSEHVPAEWGDKVMHAQTEYRFTDSDGRRFAS